MAIDAFPPGTVFSQSFGLAEQTFGGAALSQMQAFNETYQNGIAKGDTFLASSGDNGNGGAAKQHKEGTVLSTNAVGFPAVSPLVTAVGGTQLMLGWTLAPTSSNPLNFVTSSTNTEAVERVLHLRRRQLRDRRRDEQLLRRAVLAGWSGLAQRRHALDPGPLVERGGQRGCVDLHDAVSGGTGYGLGHRGRH